MEHPKPHGEQGKDGLWSTAKYLFGLPIFFDMTTKVGADGLKGFENFTGKVAESGNEVFKGAAGSVIPPAAEGSSGGGGHGGHEAPHAH